MSVNYILLLLLLSVGIQYNTAVQCNTEQNSYLWKIETEPPIYLYGTMHVSYKKIWDDIPDNVKTAFSESEQVYFELRLTDDDTLQNLSKCRYLPKGETIKDILPEDLYIRILKYLIRVQYLFPSWLYGQYTTATRIDSDRIFNAYIHDWYKQRPIWLLMLLSSLNKDNVRNYNVPSLDVFMDGGAEEMDKTVYAMENYKEQCRPFNRLNTNKVITALRILLDYYEPYTLHGNGPVSTIDHDVYMYHCGNFAQHIANTPILPLPAVLPNISLNDANILMDINNELMNKIVYRRNRRMTRSITSLLHQDRNHTTFIALGAGHYIGERNIITMLEKKNYTIKRISSTEIINGSSLPNDFIKLGDPSSQLRIIQIPTGSIATPTTITPPTLPTLPPDIVSQIINQAVNQSQQTYKIDSVEVTPTTSVTVTTPTATPSQGNTKSINYHSNDVPSSSTSNQTMHFINISLLLSLLIVLLL